MRGRAMVGTPAHLVLIAALAGVRGAGTEPPRFTSKGQQFTVVVGDTLELPCAVEHLGSHVLLWRRGDLILSAARLMVARDARYSLLRQYDLGIANVTSRDQGDYTCQIADVSAQDQVHRVNVLAPASVSTTGAASAANGQVVARKGGSVTLGCAAHGNPLPTLLWSKKDSGHLYRPGGSVTLDRVDRHHAGVYRCTASNGVGPPAALDVRLDVLHPPEIEVEQGWVNAAEGGRVTLACVVHGNPTPNLAWYQEGALVVASGRHSTDTSGNRHTLEVAPVAASDFGNFSCVAENPLGRAKHTVQLTGKPGRVRVVSSPYSSAAHTHTIVWQVDSAAPVVECRALYRTLMINESHQGAGSWREVSFRPPPPPVGTSSPPPQPRQLSLRIVGLRAASVFQARLLVRNRYGWSESSEPHQFYTRSADHLTDNSMGHFSSRASSCQQLFRFCDYATVVSLVASHAIRTRLEAAGFE